MNQPARNLHPAQRPADANDTGVSLHVLDQTAFGSWPPPRPVMQDGAGRCLVCLVTLQGPTLKSPPARRLRLKDSLAGGIPSRNAGILARDPHFWDYLQQINLTAYEAEIDRRRARHFINRVCGVEGRYDLDRHGHASHRFHTLIEQPFLNWLLADLGR